MELFVRVGIDGRGKISPLSVRNPWLLVYIQVRDFLASLGDSYDFRAVRSVVVSLALQDSNYWSKKLREVVGSIPTPSSGHWVVFFGVFLHGKTIVGNA